MLPELFEATLCDGFSASLLRSGWLHFAVGMTIFPTTEKNFIRIRLVDFSHTCSSVRPQTMPLGWISEFGVRVCPTTGYETGEGLTTRVLSGWVVSQVETPPDVVTDICK